MLLPWVPLSSSCIVPAPSFAPTHGVSREPTMTAACCAMATLAAAARRSGLLAIASATMASSTGSLNAFSQSLLTASALAVARHAGAMRVVLGSACPTVSLCVGGA